MTFRESILYVRFIDFNREKCREKESTNLEFSTHFVEQQINNHFVQLMNSQRKVKMWVASSKLQHSWELEIQISPLNKSACSNVWKTSLWTFWLSFERDVLIASPISHPHLLHTASIRKHEWVLRLNFFILFNLSFVLITEAFLSTESNT